MWGSIRVWSPVHGTGHDALTGQARATRYEPFKILSASRRRRMICVAPPPRDKQISRPLTPARALRRFQSPCEQRQRAPHTRRNKGPARVQTAWPLAPACYRMPAPAC